MKPIIKTAVFILASVVIVWPLAMTAAAVCLTHESARSIWQIAALGGLQARQFPLSAYWVALFGPLCLMTAAILSKRLSPGIIATSAVAGAIVAPIQWTLANNAYGGQILSCIADPTTPGALCGLPPQYKSAFAIAGAITGLLIGLAIARVKLKA